MATTSPLSSSSASNISQFLDEKIQENVVPGCSVSVVGRDGTIIYDHVSGITEAGKPDSPITKDTMFYVASLSKLMASVAVMQLVEKGQLFFDDANWLARIMPEIKERRIIEGYDADDKPIWNTPKTPITLRMLMTHTAGFAHSAWNSTKEKLKLPAFCDGAGLRGKELFNDPLVSEPGTKVHYGTGFAWVGVCIERVTGMRLQEYMAEHLWKPLGMTSSAFVPDEQMRKRLAWLSTRHEDTSVAFPRSIEWLPPAGDKAAYDDYHQDAGTGAYTNPTDYCQLFSMLLSDGVHPTTGTRILSPSSVNELFKNQLPHFPDCGRQNLEAGMPFMTNPVPEFYPQEGNPAQGWSLAGMMTLSKGETGRSANTVFWVGAPGSFWWLDREKRVGGVFMASMFPFWDKRLGDMNRSFEKMVYEAIEKGR